MVENLRPERRLTSLVSLGARLRKPYQDALDAAMYIVKTTAELLGKFMSGGFAAGTGMPIPIPVA